MLIIQHGKEIEEINNSDMDEIFANFSLMSEHYIDQDEIEFYFLAKQESKIVGFMGVGYCGRTVLIEVLEKGKGIGSRLVYAAVKSGSTKAWQPRQDGCEGFWAKMAEWASRSPECDMRLC